MNKTSSISLFLLFFCLVFACKTETKEIANQNTRVDNATVTVRIMKEPSGLSPILATTSARQIYRLIYGGLLDINPKDLSLIPYLAKNNPIISAIEKGPFEGGKKYTFEIREEAKWDDGKPITVHDVIFSTKIIYHPKVKTRYGPIADLFKGFEIDETQERKFSILTDKCHILTEETIGTMLLYPEHVYDPEKSLREYSFETMQNEKNLQDVFADNSSALAVGEKFMSPEVSRIPEQIIGAGPYRLKEWVTGQKIVLEKKKNWWGEKNFTAIPEQIVYEVIPDHVTALTKLGNNELDICGDLSFDLFNDQKSKANVKDCSYDINAIYYLTLNNEFGLLKDKKVRQALAHATNIEEIIDNVTYGYAQSLSGPYPPKAKFYDSSLSPRKYDPSLSAEILASAGWGDSDNDGIKDKMINGKKKDLSLDFYVTSSGKNMKPISELFKNSAKKAGFKINVITKDAKLIRNDHLKTGKYDIAGTGTTAPTGLFDPKNRWHSESIAPKGGNYPRFNNTRADELIDAIRHECDDDQRRKAMYLELHQIIYDEQPVIFLYLPKALMLSSNKVENLVTSRQRPGYFPEYINKKK